MKQNCYESDKNRIVHIPNTVGTGDDGDLSTDAQQLQMGEAGNEWDRSPSSVAFSPDGNMLLFVTEDKGDEVLFNFNLVESSSGSAQHPQALTRCWSCL